MKILNLKIINPSGEEIRNLKFEEIGILYIYGDMQEPNNSSGTINSLGKTLLLKLIDYIFGANNDTTIIKEEIHKYELKATVLFNEKKYIVQRILGNSENIYIDGKPYLLTEYKKFFELERNLLNKQIILKKKGSEISYTTRPNQDDIVSNLKLLGFKNIIEEVNYIYDAQNKIKNYKNNKKDLVSVYFDGTSVEKIDEQIFYIDKMVDKFEKDISEISHKIKSLEIADIQLSLVEEFSEKSKRIKSDKTKYEKNKVECERLDKFLINSDKSDISSSDIIRIFERAKQEIPTMIKKNIEQVELFHKKVYEERKEYIKNKKVALEKEMLQLKGSIINLTREIDKIGEIISNNEIYKESIELYEKYNSDLQNLKYKQGMLAQVKAIDNLIKIESDNITVYFNMLNNKILLYEELLQKCRDFIFSITNEIYDGDVYSYFDIKIRSANIKNRPVIFDLSLKGDTGEGVGEVKKTLMDYLLCKFNKYIEIMIQDSACYSGMDPRQVSGLLMKLGEISLESNKQIIISINKYQIGNNEELIDIIEKNNTITLSENNYLFGFKF